MIKTNLLLASLTILASFAPGFASADEATLTGIPTLVIYECQSAESPATGLSLRILQHGQSYRVQAANRDGLGPIVNLGSEAVHIKPVPQGVCGAGETFLGNEFELFISTDTLGTPQGIHSHVYADINGRVFNEDMYCRGMQYLLAQ